MAKDRLSGTLAVILHADAEWEADIVQILNPDFTVENLRSAVPFKDPKYLETFLGATRIIRGRNWVAKRMLRILKTAIAKPLVRFKKT